jgi:LDH2 family malate/lactate/ureidoglycolate dehydrogenase
MACQENMIGLIFTNARPSVCPTFGVEPLLGTNPICFSAPTDLAFPFIYDAATSITQRGKIEQYAREEKETPVGWAIDLEGKPYTDTNQLLVDLVKQQASLLPLGGTDELTGSHKGYGLATMVEILCAALQNGCFLDQLLGQDENGKAAPYKLGHFFMAINIEFFTDLASFKKTTGDICRKLQNSRRFPGQNRIWVAGEKEYEKAIEVRREGIPVIPNLRKDIEVMQKELNIVPPVI